MNRGSFLLIGELEMGHIASSARLRAARGVWDGGDRDEYFHSCISTHRRSGSIIIFTRDTGMHSSGWMKNPDYERCFHLSLSYRDHLGRSRPHDWELSNRWIRAFYKPDEMRLLWAESPKFEPGKERDVWHWRLFCDEHWQPMLPRGEVYSTDFTEKGWKSASEVGSLIVSTVDPS